MISGVALGRAPIGCFPDGFLAVGGEIEYGGGTPRQQSAESASALAGSGLALRKTPLET